MKMSVITNPQTPSKAEEKNRTITSYLSKLSYDWDLKVTIPQQTDSPRTLAQLSPTERDVIQQVRYLTFKGLIEPVFEQFEAAGQVLYNGWVKKANAQREKLPACTTKRPRLVTPHERQQLMECFLRLAVGRSQHLKNEERTRFANSPHRRATDVIDDSPIPFGVPSPSRAPKRTTTPEKRSGGLVQDESPSKKSKLPGLCEDPVSAKNVEAQIKFREDPFITSTPARPPIQSALTSFTTSSQHSSIFDPAPKDALSQLSTQETVPEVDHRFDTQTYRDVNDSQSSTYGSVLDAADIIDLSELDHDADLNIIADQKLSQDLQNIVLVSPGPAAGAILPEDRLRARLQGIFPNNLPQFFSEAPLYFQYEILRVSTHTGVPLSDLTLPRRLDYGQYDRLWAHLRALPVMNGKQLPPESEREVWTLLAQGLHYESRGIIMSSSLLYPDDQSSSSPPLLQFRLRPLKLDHTHRLERRFGSDRFLEIDLPNITGSYIPKALKSLGPSGKAVIIDWLRNSQKIIGRSWVSFCHKSLRTKPKKRSKESARPEVDNTVAYRIYLFAVDGDKFHENSGTPKECETLTSRSKWTIEGLLNWVRPTLQNTHQPFLKLYARTSLALSRNTATVIVGPPQIIYKRDVEFNGEVMSDGAGRISTALARQIVACLGLDYMPSGFQGRFGDAKGFWSIDPSDTTDHEWIEVYESQRKWERNAGCSDDPDYDDPAHRTFEVNNQSAELKSADLNTQLLPILVDRAIDKPRMIEVIGKILEDVLTVAIRSQRRAMEHPQTCRVWTRDTNSHFSDKIKLGAVPYTAGLPTWLDERMNLLLDVGFHPIKLQFLREMAQSLYTSKCDELRDHMKITVSRSTYAYMVPDFAGVLEPDEVFIHMSKDVAKDDLSPQSGLPLHGIDLLVARLPAHFASDIQKVKAVIKFELLGLKDVIVFSTKGNPSLAAKLSGGDYDGDMAWVCWEQSIVKNFENTKVPKCPDLVAEGYIEKVSMTYEDLVRDVPDPTSTFLWHAFEFNLEQSMLGPCTTFKEDWSYSQQDLNSTLSIYQAKLLSDLVDQAKQGYIFTNAHWDRFREDALNGAKRSRPAYKDEPNTKSPHVRDRLRCIADMTISRLLTEFHADLPNASYWDNDLVKLSEWAHREATTDPEWLGILKKLKADIEDVKIVWHQHYGKRSHLDEGHQGDFGPVRDKCFDLFCSIQPVGDTQLIRSWLESWLPNPELSKWALLRASVAFATYNRNYVPNFVWWMAGRQLCHLKAKQQGGISVTPSMSAMQKPDAAFVKRRMCEEAGRLDNFNVLEVEADEVVMGDWL